MATKTKQPKHRASLADAPSTGFPVMAGGKSLKEDRERERHYRAQGAMETLMRAEEHRADPKLMADVKRLAADVSAKAAKVAKCK